jgi:hypothetical protein
MKMLGETEKRLADEGMQLWLEGLDPEAPAVVRRSKLGETSGRERSSMSNPQQHGTNRIAPRAKMQWPAQSSSTRVPTEGEG